MPAFQIQIPASGSLDGASQFVWPTTLPTPVNGVYVIASTAGVAVGRFDLDAIPGNVDQLKGWWLKAFHVECNRSASGTAALRAQIVAPGQNSNREIMPDYISPVVAGDENPLIAMRTLFPECVLPRGAQILLYGATSSAFSAATAGPYNIYFEVEPIVTDRAWNALMKLSATAADRMVTRGIQIDSFQGVAATLTERIYIRRHCYISRAYATSGALPAAGESMTFGFATRSSGSDVGVAISSAVMDNATYTTINSRLNVLSPAATFGTGLLTPGTILSYGRTYVAGGGPTPIANTVFRIELTPIPCRVVHDDFEAF